MKILLNDDSFVKLMNRRVVRRMKFSFSIYNDNNLKIFLITNKINVLTKYVKMSMNVERIETIIKT